MLVPVIPLTTQTVGRLQTRFDRVAVMHSGMIGVQRVEAELRDKFSQARVRRIDSDTMQKPADYAEMLSAFERRECDILVGTQMIAKGLDFPFVSFVGVVSADTALSINDFRAEERTFQLVLQVAGRSGRGQTGGDVVVQTFSADATPIRHAVDGDYEGFADLELGRRQEANLPPVTRMVRIILADSRHTIVSKAAAGLAAALGGKRKGTHCNGTAVVLGASAAVLAVALDALRDRRYAQRALETPQQVEKPRQCHWGHHCSVENLSP